MTPEALIKSKIRDLLKNEWHAYYFAPVQMGMGISTVDILCSINGRFVGIEVKVPGKSPTVRQSRTIADINASGGFAFWTDSVEQCMSILQGEFALGRFANAVGRSCRPLLTPACSYQQARGFCSIPWPRVARTASAGSACSMHCTVTHQMAAPTWG